MQPSTRAELVDYCKRKLGAPVLEINVADEQIEDLVDDAIQYFHERHFDGVGQVFLKYQITQDDINRGRAPSGLSSTAGITTTTAEATIVGKANSAPLLKIDFSIKKLISFSVLSCGRICISSSNTSEVI